MCVCVCVCVSVRGGGVTARGQLPAAVTSTCSLPLPPFLSVHLSVRFAGPAAPPRPAQVQEAADDLGVLVEQHAGEREGRPGAAQGGQLAAEQQLGQQQVAHHAQVPQDVQRHRGRERDHAAAGQVVQHRAQAAEHDEQPQPPVVLQRRAQPRPVLQRQGRHRQDEEAGDGHQVEQEHRIYLLLLEQDACGAQTDGRTERQHQCTFPFPQSHLHAEHKHRRTEGTGSPEEEPSGSSKNDSKRKNC